LYHSLVWLFVPVPQTDHAKMVEALITASSCVEDVPVGAIRRELLRSTLVLEQLCAAIEQDSAREGRGPGVEEVSKLLEHQAAIGTG
jgi:hypothetical protein